MCTFASNYIKKKRNNNKIRKEMKMKRIILALTMLVAITATASAQAEIKCEKLVHNFGTFEESNIYFHQRGRQTSYHQPGYC